MLKFYECKVCDVPCIGMPHDGATYEKEVCSPECLAKLQSAQQSVEPTGCYACADTGIIRCDGIAVNCPICNSATSG